jgi:hypothetical protein
MAVIVSFTSLRNELAIVTSRRGIQWNATNALDQIEVRVKADKDQGDTRVISV